MREFLTARPPSTDHGDVVRSTVLKALIAATPPLLLYVGTGSSVAPWFDSGELVAAASDFGVSHPPGQPLTVILLGFAHVLPVGSLAFRMALLCALLGTVAIVALTFAFEHTLRTSDAIRASVRFPLALAGAWWVAGTYAWWFQAVRPEVYASQAALLAIAAERLLRASLGPRSERDVRPVYQAGLAFGLALANHHYLGLLAVLPSVWLGIGLWRTFGARPFGWAATFVAAGLCTYVFLPLRGLAEPYLNLGDPSTPARLWWVVSAQAFQKSVGPEAVAPFSERLTDVLVVTGEDLHAATLVVALLGAYFMLRLRATRKYGLFWLTLWVVFAVGRAAIGFVHGNPDAIAYFMLSYAALAVFAVFAVGVVVSALAEAAPSAPRLGPAIAATLALAATLQFPRSVDRSSLAGFIDSDVFDDGLRRVLPARSVVLAHNPQTIFRYWGGEAEEANRPDVTMIPLPLLTYPKLVDRFVKNEPELKPLLRSYVLDGRLSAAELQSLATLRPVFVEMDIRVERELMDLLVPEHLYHRVLTADLTDGDEVRAARDHRASWEDVFGRLGRPLDPHTVTQLLWRHYTDSLYFSAVGDTDAALRTVDWGLHLNPHAAELLRLREALQGATPGDPIDVSPFTIR